MTEINSLTTLLHQIAKSENLNPPWGLFLFGSSRSDFRAESDVDLLLVYRCGDEGRARRFRVDACKKAWGLLKLQLDITLLSKEEEEAVRFISRERAKLILTSGGAQ
ncbi:nucleotidyltransferase domain-containing protein [Streptomyces sp. NPDC017405]|uniref:nucleotidyltransferase domain-containing protein n=1 Tax=unclassified Streptomyces TaxID=2593676 RepID=UPI0037A66BE5